jgi:hypothetical protein
VQQDAWPYNKDLIMFINTSVILCTWSQQLWWKHINNVLCVLYYVHSREQYKESSIISGTGAAIWSKLTLGLLATITLEVVPFGAYAPFPALLSSFKSILEVVFCEGVRHRLRFCLSILSCVKMVAFQFYLQSGKQKSRVDGRWQSCCASHQYETRQG